MTYQKSFQYGDSTEKNAAMICSCYDGRMLNLVMEMCLDEGRARARLAWVHHTEMLTKKRGNTLLEFENLAHDRRVLRK